MERAPTTLYFWVSRLAGFVGIVVHGHRRGDEREQAQVGYRPGGVGSDSDRSLHFCYLGCPV